MKQISQDRIEHYKKHNFKWFKVRHNDKQLGDFAIIPGKLISGWARRAWWPSDAAEIIRDSTPTDKLLGIAEILLDDILSFGDYDLNRPTFLAPIVSMVIIEKKGA